MRESKGELIDELYHHGVMTHDQYLLGISWRMDFEKARIVKTGSHMRCLERIDKSLPHSENQSGSVKAYVRWREALNRIRSMQAKAFLIDVFCYNTLPKKPSLMQEDHLKKLFWRFQFSENCREIY